MGCSKDPFLLYFLTLLTLRLGSFPLYSDNPLAMSKWPSTGQGGAFWSALSW